MSKHYVEVADCDDCGGMAVTERTVTLDKLRPVLLDLCEACDKRFIDLTILLGKGLPLSKVAKRKSPKKATSKVLEVIDPDLTEPVPAVEVPKTEKAVVEGLPKKKAHPCPLCEGSSSSREGLGTHLRTAHGTGFRALKAEGVIV